MNRKYFYALIITVLLVANPLQADQNTVLLFPFSVYSENNMDFLKKGTGDLIETHLTGNGLRILRSETEVEKNEAMTQSESLSAGSFVTGSLTFLGNTISINASLVDTKTGDTVVSYVKADSDKDRLFSHIKEFTEQASEKLVKKQIPDTSQTVVQEAVPAAADHGSNTAVAPVAVASDLFLTSEPVRSDDLPGEIVSICTGDVDGDGVKDLIYAERHSFTVAVFNGKNMDIRKRTECKNFLNILFVDTFDANKNGLDEIFVTAIHSKTGKVYSTVYEWNGKAYEPLREDLPYFFRAGNSPETGKPVLLGQDQHMGREIFDEPVFEMIWSAGRQNYIPLKVLKTPAKDLNIFSMATGDLKNNGIVVSMTYHSNDRLAVVDFLKQSSWKSIEPYGGSNKFIELKNQDIKTRFYIPPRLIAGDFDKNNSQEIATVVNINSTPKIFNNMRKYVQGRIECLTWRSLRFETLWKTKDATGYIPDFVICDIDGDGKNEVIYPVVVKGGLFSGKDTSHIVFQTIDL